MTHGAIKAVIAASLLALGASSASAGCVSKGAVATSDSEKSAKWYAMETMVQAVSWGLWPGWLSTGKVEGYSVKGERYRCSKDGGGVTCHGRAVFCTK
jgi:hypothetical protein